MRPRSLDTLAATPYDVLVIGGGIHGLAIAYDAASRGLRTALIEAADFGGAASFNHQKTVHGGLRSLQYGRLRYARHSIRERRALARIAPWLLRPLPFLVGTYRSMTRGRVALRAAFKIDAWIGRDRNAGVEPELHLPAPRLLSKAATLRFFPGIRSDRLTGGAQWYDYQMVEADRLTFAFAAAADRAGATLANYVEALAPIREDGRVAGMRARDLLTGTEIAIRAAATVNAAGARGGEIMSTFGVSRQYPLVKVMSLLTNKPASDIALAAPARNGRMLTLVPWRGRALVGTSQSSSYAQPGDTGVSAAEVGTLVADANSAFPALKITADDVRLVHRGLVPAVKGRHGQPDLRMIPDVFDHASEGAPGAYTVASAKYSSARGVAERVTAMVARRLGKRVPPSRTAAAILPGAGIADHEALSIERCRALNLELPIATIRHLIARYAERSPDVITLIHERPELGAPLSATEPTLGAEIVYVIQHEMAHRLSDIVLRRTGLGNAGHPGNETIAAAARIAGEWLEWDAERTADEIEAVQRFYVIDGSDEGKTTA
jgi:glycerol-3-phosphate dehydrogenase